jgi:hypothetical protein
MSELRGKGPYDDRGRTTTRYGLNPATQITQHCAFRISDTSDQRHAYETVLPHREIDCGFCVPLEHPKRPGVDYTDDRSSDTTNIDDRAPNRLATEVEIRGFLIDHAYTALARHSRVGKPLACDQR